MLKSMFFYQLALLSNKHVLMSYLTVIYLESWFSWLAEWVQKTLKKEGKEKWRIQGKLNNNNKYILLQKIYFDRKNSLKKAVIPSHFIYNFYALQNIWKAVIIEMHIYKL